MVSSVNSEEVLWFKNYNLDEIFTPVDANKFGSLLEEAGYPSDKTEFFRSGFSVGFPLHYDSPSDMQKC